MRRNVFRMKEEGYLEELESMNPEGSQSRISYPCLVPLNDKRRPMKVTLIDTHSLTSLLHEGEEVVEEVLPLGAVGQFVELQERGEEKAFSSRRRQSVRPPCVVRLLKS